MMLLVDTSVWSLALRRDVAAAQPEVLYLQQALLGSQAVVMTGLVLQELLQGFSGPKARAQIIADFHRCRSYSRIDKTMWRPPHYARRVAGAVFKSERSMPCLPSFASVITSRF